jgi:hypothetical protein
VKNRVQSSGLRIVSLCCVLSIGASACLESRPDAGDDLRMLGTIRARLQLGDAAIDRVQWTLFGSYPNYYQASGTFDVSGAGHAFTGIIADVPEGQNYQLALSAVTVGEAASPCDALSLPWAMRCSRRLS